MPFSVFLKSYISSPAYGCWLSHPPIVHNSLGGTHGISSEQTSHDLRTRESDGVPALEPGFCTFFPFASLTSMCVWPLCTPVSGLSSWSDSGRHKFIMHSCGLLVPHGDTLPPKLLLAMPCLCVLLCVCQSFLSRFAIAHLRVAV